MGQYIFESDGITQSPKTLGWILPEIKELIGEDLYELANYVLIDKARLNIRDRVAHGKTDINSQNLNYCIRVLQLLAVFSSPLALGNQMINSSNPHTYQI